MKQKTIKNRLRLLHPALTDEELNTIHKTMAGTSDKDTEIGQKHNRKWANAVASLLKKRLLLTTKG